MMFLIEWLESHQFVSGGVTLVVLGAAVSYLRRLPSSLCAFVLRWVTITLEIPDRDPAYRWIQAWVAEQRFARRARNLSLTTVWASAQADSEGDGDSDGESTGRISEARFLLTPAPGVHILAYQNRLIVFHRSRRELESGGACAFQETLTLQLLLGNRAMLNSLLHEAQRAAMPKVGGVNIFTAKHGYWSVTSCKPRRPLGSIVLADGLLEEILADMRGFLNDGAWYTARGVPHRRGYLLYGPPGNGKTTLVTSVAGELGLSVAVLSLSNSTLSDEGLRALVDALPAGAILLFEDIDCAFRSSRESDKSVGVTLSGLLNALDGISSREGRILFLTTNHPERLDDALVRPGRVDRKILLDDASPEQARGLFLWFYSEGRDNPGIARLADRFAARVRSAPVSVATIQEVLLRHRHDPEAAVEHGDLCVRWSGPSYLGEGSDDDGAGDEPDRSSSDDLETHMIPVEGEIITNLEEVASTRA